MARVEMSDTDTKCVTIEPKELRSIPDILKKKKFIEKPTKLPLNKREIYRAMQNAVVKENDIFLDTENYNTIEEDSKGNSGCCCDNPNCDCGSDDIECECGCDHNKEEQTPVEPDPIDPTPDPDPITPDDSDCDCDDSCTCKQNNNNCTCKNNQCSNNTEETYICCNCDCDCDEILIDYACEE